MVGQLYARYIPTAHSSTSNPTDAAGLTTAKPGQVDGSHKSNKRRRERLGDSSRKNKKPCHHASNGNHEDWEALRRAKAARRDNHSESLVTRPDPENGIDTSDPLPNCDASIQRGVGDSGHVFESSRVSEEPKKEKTPRSTKKEREHRDQKPAKRNKTRTHSSKQTDRAEVCDSSVLKYGSAGVKRLEKPEVLLKTTNDRDLEEYSEPETPTRNGTQAPNAHDVADREIRRDGNDTQDKHSNILSKYRKSAKAPKPEHQAEQKNDTADETQELRDLEPIPQPTVDSEPSPEPKFSTLPSWISEPILISPKSRQSFRALHVRSDIVEQLSSKGFSYALPVQAGLLPLLLPTEWQHPGDICVSAETGSGKTLGYVIPIIQSLKYVSIKRLRALIVVPTRELVTQVKEVLDTFVAGSRLRVATAIGSRPLDQEREMLVRQQSQHDAFSQTSIGDLSLELYRGASPEDSDDSSDFDDIVTKPADYIPSHKSHYTSNIDILVATPGRLVEHLRTTKGFNLSDLEWLVVDEADRLMDESFQDWSQTLNHAINRHNHPSKSWNIFAGNPWLSGLFWDPLPLGPRKIILSATMSTEVDRLSVLRLNNPRLVVMDKQVRTFEGEEDGSRKARNTTHLTLPSNLHENAVPVEIPTEKPLYLLQLLRRIFDDFKPPASGPKTALNNRPQSDKMVDSKVSSYDSDTGSSTSSDALEGASASSSSSDSPSPDGEGPSSKRRKIDSRATPSETQILVFTSTSESAARLSNVLSHMISSSALGDLKRNNIATLTKSTTSTRRSAILASMRNTSQSNRDSKRAKEIRILISTDRSSRGLDVPSLTHVISYDVPHSVESYVHRVGRTARAGRHGEAWTLVEGREAAWFWKTVAATKGNADGNQIDRSNTPPVRKVRLELSHEDGSHLRAQYEAALKALQQNVNG